MARGREIAGLLVSVAVVTIVTVPVAIPMVGLVPAIHRSSNRVSNALPWLRSMWKRPT